MTSPERCDGRAEGHRQPAVRAGRLALMITRRCTMACSHCSVESGPQVSDPSRSEEELLTLLREAAAAGVVAVQLTGGEPMIRPRLVLRLLREASRLGMASTLSTNGFWGRTPSMAASQLRALRRAGLGTLTLSYDRFHAAFQGAEPLVNIVRAAAELPMPVNVNVTRLADESELEAIVRPFRGLRGAQLRFYDVQPLGAAARTIGDDQWRGETGGFCNACATATITDDGRVMACNGPSYFVPAGNPLHVGELKEQSLGELVAAHHSDPVLETIRTFGPRRLQEELRGIPGFEAFSLARPARSMCDLCLQLTGNTEAMAALREHLSSPAKEAERLTMARLIEAQRQHGSLNRRNVNSGEIARLFHLAMTDPATASTVGWSRILGRADLDWHQQSEILIANGLARPLLPVLETAELRRWAPVFFLERIREAAIRDGLIALMHREILQRLDAALRAIGCRGVLLKGAAILARATGDEPLRAGGDIDLLVEGPHAETLRRHLLAAGFKGEASAPRTAAHHLAPVSWLGIPVEIHTRIMPACWGLPEAEMLARCRRLPGPDGTALHSLDPAGMLLHALVHTATHQFGYGSKTGWDIAHLLRDPAEPIDWELLSRWVRACRVPRAFWVPARVLRGTLALPIPEALLTEAPEDRRQRQLELIVGRLLFGPPEPAFSMNPLIGTALVLLLHDGLPRRLRYLAWLLGSEAAEARQSAKRQAPSQRLNALPRHLRHALGQYRQFRQAWRRRPLSHADAAGPAASRTPLAAAPRTPAARR